MQPNLLPDDDVYESTDRHHAQGDQNHGQSNQDLPARVDHIDISQVSRVPSWGSIDRCEPLNRCPLIDVLCRWTLMAIPPAIRMAITTHVTRNATMMNYLLLSGTRYWYSK